MNAEHAKRAAYFAPIIERHALAFLAAVATRHPHLTRGNPAQAKQLIDEVKAAAQRIGNTLASDPSHDFAFADSDQFAEAIATMVVAILDRVLGPVQVEGGAA